MSKTRAVLIRKPYQNSIGQLIHVGDTVWAYATSGSYTSRHMGTYAGYYVRDMSDHYMKDLDGDTYISAVRVDGVAHRKYNHTTRQSEIVLRTGVYPRKKIFKIKPTVKL